MRTRKRWISPIALVVLISLMSSGQAQELHVHQAPADIYYSTNYLKKFQPGDWLGNATYFFDSRNYNTLGFLMRKTPGRSGITFFGFTNFNGDQDTEESRFKLARSFSEYRVSSDIISRLLHVKHVNIQAEVDYSTPSMALIERIGITYTHTIKFSKWVDSHRGIVRVRVFPYETDGQGGQLSIGYYLPFANWFTLSGFFDLNATDYTFSTFRIVSEPAVNVKLYKKIWWMTEFRINTYETARGLDGTGIATGIRVNFH